jgi:hypothetical protein
MQHGNFEKDDPEDQHIDAVSGQKLVEPVGWKQVNGRPACESDQQRSDAADQQTHNRYNGVESHQRFRWFVEL